MKEIAMNFRHSKNKIGMLLGLSMFAVSAANAQSGASTVDERPAENTQLMLKQGQYLSVIISDAKKTDEAIKARQKYYQTAFALASKFGLQREAALRISNTIISDYKPTSLIFFSYPDRQSETALASHADWPAIKATRPDIWNELKIFSAEAQEDIAITFDPDKSYTLVVAWKKDQNSTGYEKYLDGIEPAMKRAGGRFVYKMYNPTLESNAGSETAPAQLTFVEWDTLDGFSKVRASDEYKANAPYFAADIRKLEFYRMVVPR